MTMFCEFKKKLVTIRPKPGIVQGDKPQLLLA